jgi:hypothetical protein
MRPVRFALFHNDTPVEQTDGRWTEMELTVALRNYFAKKSTDTRYFKPPVYHSVSLIRHCNTCTRKVSLNKIIIKNNIVN